METEVRTLVLIFVCLATCCAGERDTTRREKFTYLSVNQENSCKANLKGYGIINLKPLDNTAEKSTRPRFYTVYRETRDAYAESYNYTFNPCSSFNEPSNPHDRKSFGDECFHVALCKFNRDNSRYYYYPYGIQQTAMFVAILANDSDAPEVTIVYNGTGSVSMKTSYIHLKCNRSLYYPEEAQFTILRDDERMGITAELQHLCCCPGACENGLPVEEGTKTATDNSKLLVIMAVNLCVLLLAGGVGIMCYMKRTHLQFYSKLPGVQAPASIQYPMERAMDDGMSSSSGGGNLPSAYRDYEAESTRLKKKFLIPVLDDCVISSDDLELAQRFLFIISSALMILQMLYC